MPERTRGPNMYDVAKLAEVSHQTVSRVINNHPNTRPETKARVLDAMAQLGYRPNQAARSLASCCYLSPIAIRRLAKIIATT